MKTLSRSLFLLPLTLLAASCAVSHPPKPADNANFVLPDIPREPLPEKIFPIRAWTNKPRLTTWAYKSPDWNAPLKN